MSTICVAVSKLSRRQVSAVLLLLASVSSLVYLSLSLSIRDRLEWRGRDTFAGHTLRSYTQRSHSVTGTIQHFKSLKTGQPLSLKCQSCAVVSSSGTLLGKAAGKDIDRHSCVIRLNMAPVPGYQQDVGNRTTLRVMNFFLSRFNPETLPPGSLILVWGLYRRVPYLKKALGMSDRIHERGSAIYGQTLDGETYSAEVFANETTGKNPGTTKTWMSTGWFSIMIAIDICQDVHVYGMVPYDYCANRNIRDVPYHYYDKPGGPKECTTYRHAETNRAGAHRFMTEKAIFARWALRYNITFHYPEWKLDKNRTSSKLDTPFMNVIA